DSRGCFLKRMVILLVFFALICESVAMAQKPPEKAAIPAAPQTGDMANELAQQLSQKLHVKTVAGEPVKVGSVTLIPILMVDVSFAGGAMPTPLKGGPAIDGFLMSGEARPLGFVAITKKGTRFIGAANTHAK
ncbi:MAG: hypothetical protein ABFD60_01855, partial [Bryobacteraceae bacterium]